jgi:phosphate transport system protein
MTLHFQHELGLLKEKLLTMAGLAEALVSRAMKALETRAPELAQLVPEEDDALDRLEIEIDEMAVLLLAKAPLASDLRLITAIMKISRDLERIGDEATTIARRAVELNLEPPLPPSPELRRLHESALAMLAQALEAFVRRDPVKARSVPPRDKQADTLNKQIHRHLTDLMARDAGTMNRCLHLMVVSKCLERIADHATNIAEDVVYLCEALDIRHTGKGESD